MSSFRETAPVCAGVRRSHYGPFHVFGDGQTADQFTARFSTLCNSFRTHPSSPAAPPPVLPLFKRVCSCRLEYSGRPRRPLFRAAFAVEPRHKDEPKDSQKGIRRYDAGALSGFLPPLGDKGDAGCSAVAGPPPALRHSNRRNVSRHVGTTLIASVTWKTSSGLVGRSIHARRGSPCSLKRPFRGLSYLVFVL